jgi:threonine dehydrogenase-like Zn-dependent dehydrogenase
MSRRTLPIPGSDQLLVRVDAAGLCFSDVKVIQMGASHPRLTGRDLARNPLVPGHEACVTVVMAGPGLEARYPAGSRFAIQPDVWYRGASMPYGYTLDGAFAQFGLLGPEILDGDAGSYLVPVPGGMSYAAAALTEPWACVEASYRAAYRAGLRPGGRAWLVAGPGPRRGFRLAAAWRTGPPGLVVATALPADLAAEAQRLAEATGTPITFLALDDALARVEGFDDIIALDAAPTLVATLSPRLAPGGMLALAVAGRGSGTIPLDLGRIHYDGIVTVGTSGLGLEAAYRAHPARAELRPGGVAWIAGAGGAMGRMHVQRAIESAAPPRLVLATDINGPRAADLALSFGPLATAHGVKLLVVDAQAHPEELEAALDGIGRAGGLDDVQILAPDARLMEQAAVLLAPGGVISLFAGLKRGTTGAVDPWSIAGPQQIRIIGHSGSGLDDQVAIMARAGAGQLAPDRSVSAVAGLRQAPEGIDGLIAGTYSGKVVIYPAVLDFPLTGLADLGRLLPGVGAKLGPDGAWTAAAEAAFLEAVLPE